LFIYIRNLGHKLADFSWREGQLKCAKYSAGGRLSVCVCVEREGGG